MTPYDSFTSATLAVATSLIQPLFEDSSSKEEFGTIIQNTIFDLSGPKQTKRPKLNPLQEFQRKLFYGFSEINTSVQALKNIEIYIARFPYQKTAITRSAYLRYHFENYLQEIYVLRERLLKYIKIIGRSYHKDRQSEHITKVFNMLAGVIEKAMQELVDTRSNHVHHSRFAHEELSRLDTLEMLTRNTDNRYSTYLQQYYLVEYRKIRSRWLHKVKTTNSFIDDLLNMVAETFLKLIYPGEEKKLRPPTNLTR